MPCLTHPSPRPAWHHTWSSIQSCLNPPIKIQLKRSHSWGDIFHPNHITSSAAFDTMSHSILPKVLSFYKLSWSSCLCSLYICVTLTRQSPLTSWSYPRLGLLSSPLFKFSLDSVIPEWFWLSTMYRWLSKLHLQPTHLLSTAISTWRCHKGHRLNCPSSSSAFFLSWWHHTVA